jgi:GNAT superfamily N-acetyltransferase
MAPHGMVEPSDLAIEAALEAERQFVLTLGGYALEIAGATLVTHEKLPVPRFNFVQELGVGRERQTAFFERALDHYFQRALRPTFRVPIPVPDHVDAGLVRFGFRPKLSELTLLLSESRPMTKFAENLEVRTARPEEADLVASFWTTERERPEFRSALDLGWHHPNPHERLAPLLAFVGERAVSCALVYRHRSSAGIHAVTTRPEARGQGAASDLVRHALDHDVVGAGVRYSIFADSARLEARLERLGFRAARVFQEYELPPNVELAFPPPGPPGPPQWRPPRKSAGSAGDSGGSPP